MSTKEIENLKDFLIDNPDLEELESKFGGYNIFEAIGAVRQELRHTDFLSFILDPNANHSFGADFLRKFILDLPDSDNLESIDLPIEIELSSFENTEIRREWRNIDLLIIQKDLKLILAIENKVDAFESKEQLKKYSEILYNAFKGFKIIKVFLTPEGDQPENDQSWSIYSYKRLAELIEWLIKKKDDSLSLKFKHTIEDYLILLRRHIVPDERIIELCRKIYSEHKEALDLIFEHKPDIYSELSEYLTDKIENDQDIELDDSGKTHIRFRDKKWESIDDFGKGKGWTSSNSIILYEFKNLDKRLSLYLYIGPGDQTVREKLFKIYKENRSVLNSTSNRLSDKWSNIMRIDFLNTKEVEDIDTAKEEIDKKWKEFKAGKFLKIQSILSEDFMIS